jgi:hypothetical protein
MLMPRLPDYYGFAYEQQYMEPSYGPGPPDVRVQSTQITPLLARA